MAISLGAGLTAFRLWQSGLRRQYPYIFVYMSFLTADSFLAGSLNPKTAFYFCFWIVTQPILWTLDILVVREICWAVLQRHPGLATLGRWLMYAGVFTSGLISLLTLLPRISPTLTTRSRVLVYWVGAGRGITFALAVFLVLMIFAVSRYPVPLGRNALLNAVLYTLCFLCDSMVGILRTIFDMHLNPWLPVALNTVQAICLLVWAYGLNSEGERARFQLIHFDLSYERRVLERLELLNGMIRSAGRSSQSAA